MTNVGELIRAETLHNERVLNSEGSIRARLRHAAETSTQIAPPELPPEAQSLPRGFISAPVSTATYRQIWKEATAHPFRSYDVSTAHIEEARSYVQDLFDIDLSRVRVEVIPKDQWDDPAEATTLKGGVDSHLIFIPETCGCPPSELLVHEFGHTGHYTAQRRNTEIEYFWQLPVTAEFAAHFSQHNFILERLTRGAFMHAMGQFVTATYALAIFSANALQNFDSFMQSEQAQGIRQAWPMKDLVTTFMAFQQDQSYFIEQCQRGISLILALLLIDEREAMRRFIRLDRIDHSLGAKLKAAFPESGVIDAFPQINAQVAHLLTRFAS
ncbi:hypothetical protein G3A43_09405 [Paraburkholderia aspalathi]|nr:hypothetical protein [Paraburkholderia aspalathi]MBK3780442.1 hypothetical protein [Paraburkholderia aspalathi]